MVFEHNRPCTSERVESVRRTFSKAGWLTCRFFGGTNFCAIKCRKASSRFFGLLERLAHAAMDKWLLDFGSTWWICQSAAQTTSADWPTLTGLLR